MAEHDDKIYNELYSFLKGTLSDCKMASFVLHSVQILLWLGTFKFVHDRSSYIKTSLDTQLKVRNITVPIEIQKILIALSAISFFPKVKVEKKLGVITDSSIKKIIQNMRVKMKTKKKKPTIR
jgi:hypothetical protein